ncbi:MAG TPA: efflux RND transporter periplasmic adaptor subunit [Chthoniobacterales bacterium]
MSSSIYYAINAESLIVRFIMIPIFGDMRAAAARCLSSRRQMVIGSVLALGLITSCGRQASLITEEIVRPVRTMSLGVAPESGRRAFPGQAEANEAADLSFRLAGSLIELSAKIGDSVKKGQVLAKLDPQDFEVRLRAAEEELRSAQANLDIANIELSRQETLFKSKATPQKDVERAAALVEFHKSNVAALTSKRAIAQSELSYAQLTAPFDGLVAARYVENFQTVQPKQPIVRVLDTSRIKFGVDLPETVMPLLPYVKEIWVTFQAAPGKKLPATIQEISHEASRSTRTYRVTVVMDQPAGVRILPGMSGELRARAEPPSTQPAAMEVLASSLFEDGDGRTCVWVLDTSTMTVHRQPVKTSRPTTAGFLVEGVKAGQTIVVAGVHYLKDGQKVRVMESDAEVAKPVALTNALAPESGQ